MLNPRGGVVWRHLLTPLCWSYLPPFNVEIEEEIGLAADGGHEVDEVAEGNTVLQDDIDRENEQLHARADSLVPVNLKCNRFDALMPIVFG